MRSFLSIVDRGPVGASHSHGGVARHSAVWCRGAIKSWPPPCSVSFGWSVDGSAQCSLMPWRGVSVGATRHYTAPHAQALHAYGANERPLHCANGNVKRASIAFFFFR